MENHARMMERAEAPRAQNNIDTPSNVNPIIEDVPMAINPVQAQNPQFNFQS